MAEKSQVEISQTTYYCADAKFKSWGPGEKIVIGKFCSISEGVTIHVGGDHHTNLASTYPLDIKLPDIPQDVIDQARNYRGTGTTIIENDVWVGFGAFIAGGAKIRSGAVVGAKAVVFGEVPPYAIVAGNPTRIIRYRFSKPLVERMLKIAWWDWSAEEIRNQVDWFYKPIAEFVERFDPQEKVTSHGRIDHGHSAGSTNQPAHRAIDALGQLRVD